MARGLTFLAKSDLFGKTEHIIMYHTIRGFLYSVLSDTILDTNESKKTKNSHEEKKNQSMHVMHRHQAKRKRGCVQKQRAEAAYEHVKACQQHACNTYIVW
jgi:hypothetical protein